MAEPTITCPNCRSEIKLTESLAAPLVDATRREYERRLAQKDSECASREKALSLREMDLRKQSLALEAQIAERLKAGRSQIAIEEAARAKALLADEIDGKSRELRELQDVLKQRDRKLAEAQQAQAQCLQKERALEDGRRELELTIEKRVRENLSAARAQARLEAEEQLKLKVIEKEQTISSMQRQIEELRRKAEQGSQQLQGEAFELELEAVLNSRFPFDEINPVRKGEHGGDVLHRVHTSHGNCCGTILWETKRTKNWSDGWLNKLREDQRTAKAEIAVIVSHALPKEIETFELVDGVWVTHPKTMLPVAFSLRHMLIELASVRQASEGQQTKAEMVYYYLTGTRFRQRMQAIVEAFSIMQKDLDAERKVMLKQWAKRQTQIECAIGATAGLFGDLQGIAGKTIQEIEGLDLAALPLIA